jgi:hypothetical protein
MHDEWIIVRQPHQPRSALCRFVRLRERRTAPGARSQRRDELLKWGACVRCRSAWSAAMGRERSSRANCTKREPMFMACCAMRRDPTILKTRVVAQSQQQHQQMVRVDRESEAPLQRSVIEALRVHLREAMDGATALCISDYDKGWLPVASSGPASKKP